MNIKKDGRNYHISIIHIEQNTTILKCWVETIKEYKNTVPEISINWINVVKVFVYLYIRAKNVRFEEFLFTQAELTFKLNLSKNKTSISTAGNALKVLQKLKLNRIVIYDMYVKRERIELDNKEIGFKTVGTKIRLLESAF